MQSYLFIGDHHDSRNFPVTDDIESVKLPVAVMGKAAYARESLSFGDASITVYRHESLTPEQVLNRLAEHYKAWAVNQPGGRR